MNILKEYDLGNHHRNIGNEEWWHNLRHCQKAESRYTKNKELDSIKVHY